MDNARISRRNFVGGIALAGISVGIFDSTISSAGAALGAKSALAEEASYAAGTYTASFLGKFAPVTVEATFSDSKIESIAVTNNEETPRIAARALEEIPAAIVENQSLAIDTVTGATLTSVAIINAVSDCVEQAGGNPNALSTPAEDSEPDSQVDLDADLLIVGAGGAGMACAVAAAQAGLGKIVVLEKSCNVGGNALVSGGYVEYVNAPDDLRIEMTESHVNQLESDIASAEEQEVMPSEDLDKLKGDWQAWQESGNTKCFDSLELQALQYTLAGEGSYGGNVPFCSSIADLADWLAEGGFEFKELCGIVGYPWPRWASPARGRCGEGYFDFYDNAIEQNDYPIEILLNTPAQSLVTEGDKVVGATALGADGTTYSVRATKGVVLATGGFSGNADMLREYNTMWPFDDMAFIPTTNTYGHDGDGIKMALELGAATYAMDDQMPFPMADCKNWTDETTVGDDIDCVMVNAEGRRFMDEVLDRYTMTENIMAQTDQKMFMISDADTCRIDGDLNRYGRDLQNLIDQGQLFRADTIEELAEQIGCDPAVLSETIATYNEYARAGEDPDFGRTSFSVDSPIENPPFYASPRTWAMHITVGGLSYDDSFRILREDETPIEGLYGCGEVLVGSSGVGTQGEGLAVARIITGSQQS